MRSKPPSPIYLTACECQTPLGNTAETFQALRAGKISVQPVAVEGIEDSPVLPLSLFHPLGETEPPRWLEACRAMVAKQPALPWGHSGYPVLVSSSNFGIEQLLALYQGGSESLRQVATPGTAVARIAEVCDWGPDCTVISNACVSAQLAIHEGERLLQTCMAKAVLVLSFDFLSPFVVGGFAALKILNGILPRPYEDTEVGAIGLGEGLGVAVLSREPSAFRLVGSAAHLESHHMTANDPSGAGFRAIAGRVKSLAGDRHFWLKGHGTGTLDAGRLESQTFAAEFPDRPLVSWKGSLGHTLGSCGLVEMAVALEAMRQGTAPGTPGSKAPFFAPNVTAEAFPITAFDSVALFSSAFGGAHMATLIEHA